MINIISIDGSDGVGKTTLAKSLAASLGWDLSVKPYKENFNSLDDYREKAKIANSQPGEIAANFHLENSYLFSKMDKFVVERFSLTNLAHNDKVMNGKLMDVYKEIGKPLLSIILIVENDELIKRLKSRDINDSDLKKVEHNLEFQESLISYAAKMEYNHIVVNTSGKTAEQVLQEVLDEITSRNCL